MVLAGGGARGAYEVGALSVLLPYLERRDERPGVVLGTSIGAFNTAYLASTAHVPASESIARSLEIWRGVRYDDLLGPLVSVGELGRLLRYFGGLLRVPGSRVDSLLDASPLGPKVRDLVEFDQIASNVDAGVLASAAVVATSYATGESLVFHDSKPAAAIPLDEKRAIRYAPTRVSDVHVLASMAAPAVFPAINVTEPADVSGWYSDGGVRLNTPIKPALKLGAKRVVVIGLNSSALPDHPLARRPDVFDGGAQILQAVLGDQLAQDVATLAGVNRRLADGPAVKGPKDPDAVPYIFISPADRLTVGRIAMSIYAEHYASLRATIGSPSVATLGRILGADASPVRGELLSYLFFAREFILALIDLGRADADRWLAARHDDGPWHYGDPMPAPAGRPRDAVPA